MVRQHLFPHSHPDTAYAPAGQGFATGLKHIGNVSQRRTQHLCFHFLTRGGWFATGGVTWSQTLRVGGGARAGYSTPMTTLHHKPFPPVLPPEMATHKTCCHRRCFADEEGVSPWTSILVSSLQSWRQKGNIHLWCLTPLPILLLPLPTAAQHFKGKSRGVGGRRNAPLPLQPLCTSDPQHFRGCVSAWVLQALVRQLSLAGIKTGLRCSWLPFPPLLAKSDVALSKFSGISGRSWAENKDQPLGGYGYGQFSLQTYGQLP